jgi:phosphoadenosine phosphosulfate reductase
MTSDERLREERGMMTETQLQALAERGAAELEGAGANDLLRWTDEHFGGDYVVASNMADAVLVDLASKVRPGVDVLFLDTGYHFVETIGTRDAVEAVYNINVVNVTPENTVAKQDELFGKDLFAREPNQCCRMRKVEPLGKALRGYTAWVTGIRRVEAPTRANAPLICWDKTFGLVKINPIAAWTDEEMQTYIDANDVLVNPLVFEGYPSIGCAPCTAKPEEGADPRSGRWAGLSKTECGLHAS